MFAIFKTPKPNKGSDKQTNKRGVNQFTPPVRDYQNKQAPVTQPPARELDAQPPQLRTPTAQPPATKTTIIGKGLLFKGEVSGKGSIRVEGQFVGTLNIGDEVIIGQGGDVDGNINSKNVSVLGTLRGNVEASDRIHIDGTGSMIGDIIAPRVVVAEGAVYKGKIDMEPKTQTHVKPQKEPETKPEKSDNEDMDKKAKSETPGPPPKAQ